MTAQVIHMQQEAAGPGSPPERPAPLRTERVSRFIKPGWFSSGEEVIVKTEGGRITVRGEDVRVLASVPDGTEITFTNEAGYYRAYLTRELLDYREALKNYRKTQQEYQEAQARKREEARRKAAWAVNGRLRLPVPFTVGFKARLSALSATSDGSGHAANTRQHILLLADLDTGKLRRSARSFLCTTSTRDNGKRWVEPEYAGGVQDLPQVTCVTCLGLAETLAKRPDATCQVQATSQSPAARP